MDYFETHLEVASKEKIPLIVHTREADDDTISFLDKFVQTKKQKV